MNPVGPRPLPGALLLALLLAGEARGAVVPPLDPAAETVIVGGAAPPATAAARGRWDVSAQAVAPAHPAKGSPAAFWLAAGEGAQLADGTVRARLATDERFEGTLVVRARAGRGGRALAQALGLRFSASRVTLVAIDGRRTKRLGPALAVPRAEKAVEVTLSFFGPVVVANVWSGESGALVGSLAYDRATPAEGAVGVRHEAGKRAPFRVTLLAARPACHRLPEPAPAGPPQVLEVPAAAAARLEDAPPRLEVRQWRGRELVVLRVDGRTLERMFCDGVGEASLVHHPPMKFLDPELLPLRDAWRAQGARPEQADRSYKTPEMIEQLLRAWHERYPDRTRLEELGRSWNGRPILALAIGAATEPRPSVLLTGAHHGNEVLSTEFVLDAARVLLEGGADTPGVGRWLQELTVWCVPVVNPDGLYLATEVHGEAGRRNGRDTDEDGRHTREDGVDLNRNYPFRWGEHDGRGSRSRPGHKWYRGPEPASEPEVRAIMALARREHFVASLSYHTGTVAVLVPYTIDGTRDPEPNEALSITEALLQRQPPHPSRRPYRLKRKLYTVDGVDQDWLRHELGTLALLVEGNVTSPLDPAERRAALTTARPLWQGLFDRFLDGPSLSVRVLDADGLPVRATVHLREVHLREGERWTTRCLDGTRHMYLAAPGRYTVEIRAAGHPRVVRPVDVGAERAWLEVRLPGRLRKAARCPR